MLSDFQETTKNIFKKIWSRGATPRVRTLAGNFSTFYQEIAWQKPDQVLARMGTSADGLSEEEAALRLEQYGPNQVAQENTTQWYRRLWTTIKNPFNFLLATIAVVSFLTDDVPGGTIIGSMVALSVLMSFFQEHRSSKAAEKLKAMVTTTATVIRGPRQECPVSLLVPGDIVHLSAGDMIPADLRVIISKDLFVSQSSLTGEALPIEKTPNSHLKEMNTSCSIQELESICFMGSNVVSGSARAVVVRTGGETYFGSLAKNIAGAREQTSFDKGIHGFTWLMIRFMIVMAPLVFVINGLSKGNWLEAMMFALAVAVGLTPEMLPMIIAVNLAKGALSMSKKKVIVKRMSAIQNFGAMDVLCTDKTGTLTQDKVILEQYCDPSGAVSDRVLKYAYLNSFHQTGLKNLLDRAVLEHVEMNGKLKMTANYTKVDEIPFDFVRRRMSVVVEEEQARNVLICKGALEEVLSVSSFAELNGETFPIDSEFSWAVKKIARDLNEDGLRVIAVAYKETPKVHRDYSIADENEMVLIGFVAFLDPPKETAPRAIEALNKHGVTVKVLTGDNDVVTRKICSQVGLPFDRIVLGAELEHLDDAALADLTEDRHIFAKLTPMQKERVVKAMQSKGHVVGFMGDGINDAAALKAADVGISVDNAVDIAKESADIILLEKSLLVLEEGVLEGRKIFGNIIKYIKMGASSNFGNMFSVLGASLFLPFLPMLPVQLLTQNLLYDLSQTAIPFDQVDEEYLEKPRRWEIGDIKRFMIVIGPISSIFDYATFILMYFFFKANTPEHQSLFQAGWFVEGLLSQTLIVHMIRTRKIPFIQSRAAWPLIFTTAIVMAIGIIIPLSPLAAKLGFVALPSIYFAFLFVFLVMYAMLTHVVKTWFIGKYGYN